MKLKNLKKIIYIIIVILILAYAGMWIFKNKNFNSDFVVGQKIDSLNGVYVYYNGGVDNVTERNLADDDYNIGLNYQCVEFVKRYYYEKLNHKMPDTYGHAKDFFDNTLQDGKLNIKRDLMQYSNPSNIKPKEEDLIVFSGTLFNRYGHVAIISNVTENEIEITQQNPGPFSDSRESFNLEKINTKWLIKNDRILGWLRKENDSTITE